MIDIQTAALIVFPLLCALLGYWARRLENRVDLLEQRLNATIAELHKDYVLREDFRERTDHFLDGLNRQNTKLDDISSGLLFLRARGGTHERSSSQ